MDQLYATIISTAASIAAVVAARQSSLERPKVGGRSMRTRRKHVSRITQRPYLPDLTFSSPEPAISPNSRATKPFRSPDSGAAKPLPPPVRTSVQRTPPHQQPQHPSTGNPSIPEHNQTGSPVNVGPPNPLAQGVDSESPSSSTEGDYNTSDEQVDLSRAESMHSAAHEAAGVIQDQADAIQDLAIAQNQLAETLNRPGAPAAAAAPEARAEAVATQGDANQAQATAEESTVIASQSSNVSDEKVPGILNELKKILTKEQKFTKSQKKLTSYKDALAKKSSLSDWIKYKAQVIKYMVDALENAEAPKRMPTLKGNPSNLDPWISHPDARKALSDDNRREYDKRNSNVKRIFTEFKSAYQKKFPGTMPRFPHEVKEVTFSDHGNTDLTPFAFGGTRHGRWHDCWARDGLWK